MRPVTAPKPGPIREVIVVVPARDEEHLIGRCLDALLAARAHLAVSDPDVVVRITVVADACEDATEAVVREYVDDDVELLSVGSGRVGAARRAGIEALLAARVTPDLDAVWIANTDADSVVPAGWLADQVRLAAAGADVVVGTVRPDATDLTSEQNAAWLRTHVPGQPNGHVHGANLGLRASAYTPAGGFEPVAEHEDNLLVDRVRAAGAAIVASDEVEVVTSGRPVGRTPGGYATHLSLSLNLSLLPRDRVGADARDGVGAATDNATATATSTASREPETTS